MPSGLYDQHPDLMDGIDIAVLAVSRNWKVLYANQAGAKLLGKTVEELYGQHLLNTCPELVGSPYQKSFLLVMETGHPEQTLFEFHNQYLKQRLWPVTDGVMAMIEVVTCDSDNEPFIADYREVFDQVNDALFIYNLNTAKILNVNQRACTMFDYTRDELLALNAADLAAEEEPYTGDNFYKWMKRVARDQRERVLEWKVKDRAGRIFWVEVRSKTTSFYGHMHLLAVIRDITKRKQVESQLRVFEERYAELFNNAVDCIYMMDLEGNFTVANDAMQKLTGYTLEDLLGMNIRDLVVDEYRGLIEEYMQLSKDITPGKRIKPWPLNHELEIKTREGVVVTMEVNSWRVYRLGKPVAIQGIARNVSRRHIQEGQRNQRLELYETVLNCVPDPLLAIDPDGRVTVWNRAMEQYTGVMAAQMLGKDNYEYAEKICGVRRPLLVDLVLNPEGVQEAYTVIEKENHVLIGQTQITRGNFLWGKASPVWNKNGELLGAVETIRDITEQKTIEEEMGRTISELESRLVTEIEG
ncbi:MAG: PAS domain S-box protein [Methylocystaceae bacterium]